MTDPGWYSDPRKQAQFRWWDGKQWTENASGEPEGAAAPASQPTTPPPAGPAPAAASVPPVATKKSGGGSTILKVAFGVVLGIAVLIVGCGLIIAGGVDEAEDEAQEHAITKAEYDSIEQGASQSDVEADLGTPDDSQEFENRGFGTGVQGSSCIYYNEEGKDLFEGDSYQFCFDNEKLTSKAVY